MRQHDATPAVGHQLHRPFNGTDGLFDGADTGLAIQILAAHGGHAARVGQALGQQGLPVAWHRIAQARNDQNSGKHGASPGCKKT